MKSHNKGAGGGTWEPKLMKIIGASNVLYRTGLCRMPQVNSLIVVNIMEGQSFVAHCESCMSTDRFSAA